MHWQMRQWQAVGLGGKPWHWNEKYCRGLCCDKEPNRKKEPLPLETEIRDWNLYEYGHW